MVHAAAKVEHQVTWLGFTKWNFARFLILRIAVVGQRHSALTPSTHREARAVECSGARCRRNITITYLRKRVPDCGNRTAANRVAAAVGATAAELLLRNCRGSQGRLAIAGCHGREALALCGL